jgi:selenocysteine lyase/cysteine desulfurase
VSHKALFQRALAAAPDRLHFAAHSHHLWPDASWLGHQAAWQDAARLADRKWDRVMGEIWPAAQAHVAAELNLPDPSSIVFAGNTHDLILRIVSARAGRPLRILTGDGEFHSFRRQSQRWIESGRITLDTVPTGPDFAGRLLAAARAGGHDLVFVSQVMFGTGQIVPAAALADLAALASPGGTWIVIDGYHGFMALENDLSAIASGAFYLAGGYKYAMSGEGVAFLHCPPGFGPRPEITGWYAEFAGCRPHRAGSAMPPMRCASWVRPSTRPACTASSRYATCWRTKD